MKNPVLRNKWLFELEHTDMETNLDPSVSVPDEAHTIREIMEKHVRGQKIMEEIARRSEWSEKADFDDVDMEEASRMDLSDRENLANQIRAEVEQKKADLKAAQDAYKLRQKDAKEKADLRKQENDQASESREGLVNEDAGEERSGAKVTKRPTNVKKAEPKSDD